MMRAPGERVSPLIPLLISTSTISLEPIVLERLAFLEERLEATKLHAQIWWYGWLGVYAAGAIVQGSRLAFVQRDDPDAAAKRADFAVSAIKATAGVINMLFLPLNAMKGADPMRAESSDTAKLAAGEAALEANARESERALWWLRHTMVVAVNVIGGLIIWLGYDDLQRAAINAGVGIAVGEIAIWTQPWQPRESYREYSTMVAEHNEARTPDLLEASSNTR
jgi:hypothetical protein